MKESHQNIENFQSFASKSQNNAKKRNIYIGALHIEWEKHYFGIGV